ncbi:MAG: hypothetical protein A2X84_09945 [Desulfuromonadaceae bacterium GWC2_58_13]|nr:MAG: hypothetical protein A2X84_09945 [Desulfuromonadaceae bacterium GWC2_58_13]
MKKKVTEGGYRETFLAVLRWLAGVAIKCTCTCRKPRLFAPMQPDGWSVQPFAIGCRFTPDADLDPDTGTPVGDEGYYLYLLNEAAKWDYSTTRSLLFSIWQRPWGHSWLILEGPQDRLECGHTGDLGQSKLRYHDGVFQGIREGHPNPIAYLWQTRFDGQFQTGKPNRPPTFVWRMPITRLKYKLIYDYVMQRKYDQFGVRTNNCTDMVIETATLAGINLTHRIRLTVPQETKVWGRKRRVWTDPQYRILEYSTPDVLETDLRQLTQLGIGSDVTEWYLGLNQ